MVQFKRDLPVPGDREPDNTYWAIGGTAYETELARKRYRDYRPKPFTGEDFVAYKDKMERGFLWYRSCVVKELRQFIRARNIDLPKGCVRKGSLIETLEEADDEVKFTKFFDLPAELRNNIYGQYFERLGDLPQLPHQPPLLLASSAVRAEALPLYYQHSTFTLGFLTNRRTEDILSGRRMRPLRTSVHKDTQALLKRISDQDFVSIRQLRLQVWKPKLNAIGAIVPLATWTADLSGSAALVFSQACQEHRSKTWDPLLKSVGEALERALSEIRARPGAHKISKVDVYALMDVVHHAML